MSTPEDALAGLMQQYQAAVVSALDPVHGWVDPALACLEREQGAAVLTAWNPGLERPSVEVNRARNEELRARLDRLGLEVWRADGFDPESSLVEEGFLAWEMDLAVARELGREFRQVAIFAYDRQGQRLVVAC